MSSLRPVNTVLGDRIPHLVRQVIVVNGDIGSIRQFCDNWVLNESRLYGHRVEFSAASPRSTQGWSRRQADLPKQDGQALGACAAVKRIPLAARLIREERIRSLQ